MNETRWFLSALLLLFIGLKLGKVIDWSWWWVLAPFWIPSAIALTLLTIWGAYVQWFESEDARKSRELSAALKAYTNALRRR